MMNARMLTLLRESRGLNGTELSRRSGVPQSTISKMENGLAPLDDERMRLIAEALGYPLATFEWDDPIYGFGSAAFFHRKQQALPQTALRKIQAEVNLARMRLARLLRSAAIEAAYEVPTLDTASMGAPTEVARAVRAAWRLPMGPIGSMVTVLERAGVIVVRAGLESPRISAISLDAVGSYPAVITLNEGMSADRERFTLAHELGHFVMHSALGPTDEAEAEADAFASEFLMPASEIRGQLKGMTLQKAAQLKLAWRVSMSAVIRRARDLGVIDDNRYRSLNVQISQKGWRKSEPVALERETTSIVGNLLEVHLSEYGYSDTELAVVMGLSGDELRARFKMAPSPRAIDRHLRALN